MDLRTKLCVSLKVLALLLPNPLWIEVSGHLQHAWLRHIFDSNLFSRRQTGQTFKCYQGTDIMAENPTIPANFL